MRIFEVDPGLSATTISDVQAEANAISVLRRISGSGLIIGRVRTTICEFGDNRGAAKAIEKALPGEILVLGSTSADGKHSFMGDNMALAAQQRGVLAAVIDGYVRDSVGIKDLGFSVHARGLHISRAAKNGPYDDVTPVVIDGLAFTTGDYVAVDDDGVVVIPHDEIDAVLHSAEQKRRLEVDVCSLIREGHSLDDAHRLVKKG